MFAKIILMKKILLAFDGNHFPKAAFEFAAVLNEEKKILLVGLFLPEIDYANLWTIGDTLSGAMLIPSPDLYSDNDNSKIITEFEHKCKHNGIEYRVHEASSNFGLPMLKNETQFADLLLLSSEDFYSNLLSDDLNNQLKGALKEAECPVIVVPNDFIFPKQNILAYDGEVASVFAIKQFAYLFPEFTINDTTLVYAKISNDDTLPEQVNMEELTARHFSNLTITKLDIDPAKYFETWMSKRPASILITGSYGKSSFAQTFHKSFVTEILKAHRIPVFIAHHK